MFTSLTLWSALVLAADLVAIVSLLQSRNSPGQKMFWTFLILFMPALGVLLYYLFGPSPASA